MDEILHIENMAGVNHHQTQSCVVNCCIKQEQSTGVVTSWTLLDADVPAQEQSILQKTSSSVCLELGVNESTDK